MSEVELSYCLFCGNVYDVADEAEHGLQVCLIAYVERNGWLIPIKNVPNHDERR